MRSRKATILALFAVLISACGGFRRGDYWDEDATTTTASESDGDGPSFTADVLPLLIDDCASCHAAGASAGDTGFLVGIDAGADLESTLDFVDFNAPASSRLLTKAAGVGHVGGAFYSPEGPEAALILAWIEAGAPS